MKTPMINPVWDRMKRIKEALKLKSDVELYRLAGADKGLGGQWKSGSVKSIGAEYAFTLQDKTGFQARWIMLGDGPERLDMNYVIITKALPHIDPAVIASWLPTAHDALNRANENKQAA